MTETTTFYDYGMIYLVKLDESGVTLVSTQDGHLREVPADPTEGFEIESKVDVLGTYGGIRTYFIQDDKLTANDTIYEFAGDPSGELPKLTVKGSIRCRLEGGNTTLEAGDVIIPQAYSPVSYTHLVVAALKGTKFNDTPVFTGRYGLGSKDTTPAQIVAVYNNTEKAKFTIGIVDDVKMCIRDRRSRVRCESRNPDRYQSTAQRKRYAVSQKQGRAR